MEGNKRFSVRPIWFRWGVGLVFWTFVGFFFASQSYLNTGGDVQQALERAMPRWYVWGLLTPFVIRLDRWLGLPGRPLGKRLLAHLPLSLLWTSVTILLLGLVLRWLGREAGSLTPSYFASQIHWNVLIYGVIVGLYVAYDYSRVARWREVQAAELKKHLVEARLATLRAQLHPHFLFNSLNAISAYLEKDPKRARRMVAHLGDLLRFSLDQAERQTVTLDEELEALSNYLAIEQIRFEDHLRVRLEVEPASRCAQVPVFLLQPLVENAVRHGISSQAQGGAILISAARNDGFLDLRVADDGAGLPTGWSIDSDAGLGLGNTLKRLRQLYRDDFDLNVSSLPQGGVEVWLRIPFVEQEAKP